MKAFEQVEMFNLVEEFMTEFDLQRVNDDTADLYYKLVVEEAGELHEAQDEDHIEKEACDLLVTVCGLILAKTKNIAGIEDFFGYVHRSNMSKRSDSYEEVEDWIARNSLSAWTKQTPSGKYIAVHYQTGKILKGPNYKTPTQIIDEELKIIKKIDK